MKNSLVRTLQILFRQKWLMLTFFVVVVGVVNVASYTLPPIYKATAQFLVIPGSEQLPIYTSSGTVADRASTSTMRTETVISEMELVHARPVIERVSDRVGLDHHDTIDLGDSGDSQAVPQSSATKALAQRIKSVLHSIHETLVDLALINALEPREAAIDGLQKSIKVTPVFSSNVFTVEYLDDDPRLAAMVVNTLAEEYLNYRQDVYKPPGVVDHFREQLELRKSELDDARARLREYQDKHHIVNLETEIDNALKLYEDSKHTSAFNPQRDQYAARLEELREAAPIVRDMRFDVENAQQLYERYAQKFDEVSSNAELNRAKFANVRLIEPAAVDWAPVFPHRLLNVILSLFVGSLGAIGLALAANYFSDKIHAVEDVEVIGVHALGSVPLLRNKRDRKEAHASPRCRQACSLIAEQLRAPGGARGLVVRGTRTGAGSSTISIGLAQALATEADHRVLLVDTNTRDSSVRDAFVIKDGPAFLANSLPAPTSLQEAIQHTDHDRLDILSAERFQALQKADPGLMHRLLDELSSHYSFVVVDTAPMFSSASPLKGVEGWSAILVVPARRTSIQVVRRAVALLGRQGFAVLGTILNKREDSLPGFIYRRL